MRCASLDGVISHPDEARIPATDDGFLRGDGVFEMLRLYGGRPFALEGHLARLARSAANLRLPADLDAVAEDVERLLEHAGPVDGSLRIVLTRGGRRLLLVEPLPVLPASVSLACVPYSPTRVLDGVKSLSYAANMLATRLAQEQGADEALLVTPHGRVLEGPTSSFFWVRGGVLHTPPLGEHILSSITRAAIVEGLGAREESCTRADLDGVEEAFLASTVREVIPVSAIDGRPLPAAPGPVTTAARTALHERIERELARA